MDSVGQKFKLFFGEEGWPAEGFLTPTGQAEYVNIFLPLEREAPDLPAPDGSSGAYTAAMVKLADLRAALAVVPAPPRGSLPVEGEWETTLAEHRAAVEHVEAEIQRLRIQSSGEGLHLSVDGSFGDYLHPCASCGREVEWAEALLMPCSSLGDDGDVDTLGVVHRDGCPSLEEPHGDH